MPPILWPLLEEPPSISFAKYSFGKPAFRMLLVLLLVSINDESQKEGEREIERDSCNFENELVIIISAASRQKHFRETDLLNKSSSVKSLSLLTQTQRSPPAG